MPCSKKREGAHYAKYITQLPQQTLYYLIIHTKEKLIRPALSLLFPKTCVRCNDSGSYLCEPCIKNTNLIARDDCNSVCVTTFDKSARTLIHKLKYHGIHSASEDIAAIMYTYLLEHLAEQLSYYPHAQIALTYIPANSLRKKKREYNHAALIAHKLGALLDIPIIDTLKEIRSPESLAQTSSKRKRKELREYSMCAKEHLPHNTLFVVIDDVITTGTTMKEALRALSQETTIKPIGAAFAHTPRKT